MTAASRLPSSGKWWWFSASLTGLLLLSACGKAPTVQQQIVASLEAMETAAEEGRPLDLMGHVSKQFKGQQGGMQRADFQRYMLLQLNKNRRMYANFFPITVTVTPDVVGAPEATARFRLLVTGGNGLLPDQGRLFDVQTNWIREGGDWMLIGADWKVAQIAE